MLIKFFFVADNDVICILVPALKGNPLNNSSLKKKSVRLLKSLILKKQILVLKFFKPSGIQTLLFNYIGVLFARFFINIDSDQVQKTALHLKSLRKSIYTDMIILIHNQNIHYRQ